MSLKRGRSVNIKCSEMKRNSIKRGSNNGQNQSENLVAIVANPHEQIIKPVQERSRLDDDEQAGPSRRHKEEGHEETGDFSGSASSWNPAYVSDDDSSESDDEVQTKNMKLNYQPRHRGQYINKRRGKILTPSHRAKAVIINKLQATLPNNKRSPISHVLHPDVSLEQAAKKKELRKLLSQEIDKINKRFREMYQLVKDIKNHYGFTSDNIPLAAKAKSEFLKNEEDDVYTFRNETEEFYNGKSVSEESNRSDDNVLITNKYNVEMQSNNITEKQEMPNETKCDVPEEWIPIGSGKTLIHKDKYKKVLWKTYTKATRTLLMAAFPRKILATHSLTGKKSPAFLNKPAKMCLDPKIISDILIEIKDRFKVKENLVRSIITTKCADESKMYKTRLAKKRKRNRENVPASSSPPSSDQKTGLDAEKKS